MYECMVCIQQTYCHGYLTLLSNRSPNTEIDIVPVPLRSITFHSESLYTRRSLIQQPLQMPVDLAVSTVESVNEPRPSTRDLGLPETADLNTKVGPPLSPFGA